MKIITIFFLSLFLQKTYSTEEPQVFLNNLLKKTIKEFEKNPIKKEDFEKMMKDARKKNLNIPENAEQNITFEKDKNGEEIVKFKMPKEFNIEKLTEQILKNSKNKEMIAKFQKIFEKQNNLEKELSELKKDISKP